LRFSHDADPRAHLDKWYTAIRHGAERQDESVLSFGAGKDVLEYGCAGGELSLDSLHLPSRAKWLTGIDLSDVALAKATSCAEKLGCCNWNFFTMNDEKMNFADASFDLVFGRGIIHLDLNRCYAKVRRVLGPGGIAIFFEPMGHNPILNAYRKRTPELHTSDEHPLMVKDFTLAQHYFGNVDVTYYGLATVANALVEWARVKEPLFASASG
jgi:SAM-dependent methyltransferase